MKFVYGHLSETQTRPDEVVVHLGKRQRRRRARVDVCKCGRQQRCGRQAAIEAATQVWKRRRQWMWAKFLEVVGAKKKSLHQQYQLPSVFFPVIFKE